VIPYGKRHPVVLRWIPIKNLSGLFLTFFFLTCNTVVPRVTEKELHTSVIAISKSIHTTNVIVIIVTMKKIIKEEK